jgi:hypothetical protein
MNRKAAMKRHSPRKSSPPKQRKASYSRVVEFPEVKGLTVEKVALSTDSDFPCISIRFQDKTDLTVVIDPWLTFQADYSRWKDGNQKVLKRWPVFRSDGM